MEPRISEFSYGYAVTEAMATQWRPDLTAAPVFPSLVQEGLPGGGYDVYLNRRGVPLFLQFKLSHYMVRSNAREARLGLLTVPFYRMYLRALRHSDQHQLLLDLENVGNAVYYVAPLFHRADELNAAYLAGQVLRRSIFVRPSAIGPLPDSDVHRIAFDGTTEWFLSEPRRFEKILDQEAVARETMRDINDRGAMALTVQALESLKFGMLEILERTAGDRRAHRVDMAAWRQPGDSLRQIVYLSRTFFDSECLVAIERRG